VTAVFVDSGAWIALVKRNDRLHAHARRHYERLYADGVGLLTTNYVVNETVTRLRYDAGLGAAREFRARIGALCDLRRARIMWIDEQLEVAGWRILEQNADIQLSLTDATSAAVARATRITAIFGFDADFQALGFVVAPTLA
jgi:uncharacterized protein